MGDTLASQGYDVLGDGCKGNLIHPDIVQTAPHCLVSAAKGGDEDEMFRPPSKVGMQVELVIICDRVRLGVILIHTGSYFAWPT